MCLWCTAAILEVQGCSDSTPKHSDAYSRHLTINSPAGHPFTFIPSIYRVVQDKAQTHTRSGMADKVPAVLFAATSANKLGSMETGCW